MAPADEAAQRPSRPPAADRGIDRTLDPDYEAIHAAVTETARGRWFLEEYARRNRTADTRALLTVLERLEDCVLVQQETGIEEVRAGLADIAGVLGRARAELAALPGEDGSAPGRRDPGDVDFVREADRSSAAAIAGWKATERIQAMADGLRERGVPFDLCDAIEGHAHAIDAALTACTTSFKGMAAMGRALREIEARLDALAAPEEQASEEAPVEETPVADTASVDAPAEEVQAAIPAPPVQADPPPAVLREVPPAPQAHGDPSRIPAAAATGGAQPRAAPEPARSTPPADLTGLTFDQKMILFS